MSRSYKAPVFRMPNKRFGKSLANRKCRTATNTILRQTYVGLDVEEAVKTHVILPKLEEISNRWDWDDYRSYAPEYERAYRK